MKPIALSLFACIAASALAIAGAPAAVRMTYITPTPAVAPAASTNQQAPAPRSTSTHHRRGRSLSHALRKQHRDSLDKPQAPSPKRDVVRVASRSSLAAAQKAAARAQIESSARAERLYRSSQFSAPIIKDAKACKRIGAHGESIYENC